jgi:hypothetical protein
MREQSRLAPPAAPEMAAGERALLFTAATLGLLVLYGGAALAAGLADFSSEALVRRNTLVGDAIAVLLVGTGVTSIVLGVRGAARRRGRVSAVVALALATPVTVLVALNTIAFGLDVG